LGQAINYANIATCINDATIRFGFSLLPPFYGTKTGWAKSELGIGLCHIHFG